MLQKMFYIVAILSLFSVLLLIFKKIQNFRCTNGKLVHRFKWQLSKKYIWITVAYKM